MKSKLVPLILGLALAGCGEVTQSMAVAPDAGSGGSGGANTVGKADAGTGGTAPDAIVGGGSGGATAEVGAGGGSGSGGAQDGGAGGGGSVGTDAGTGGATTDARSEVAVSAPPTCMAVNGWEPTGRQYCVNNPGFPLFKTLPSGKLQCLTCLPTPFGLQDRECTVPSSMLCVHSCSECSP